MCQSRMFWVLLACWLVVFAGTTAASATLTSDGDFNAQTLTQTIGGAWNIVNGYTCQATSQSPFTEVFDDNGKGAYSAGGGPPYLVQSFAPIATDATGTYYANWDFQIASTNTLTGAASFMLTNGDGYRSAASIGLWAYVLAGGATAFYAQGVGGGLGDSLFSPVQGDWYNVQLALNVGSDTYAMRIVRSGAGGRSVVADLTNLPFIQSAIIDRIYSAQMGDGQVERSFDNIVVSNVNSPLPATIIPEPGTLAMAVTGMIGLLAHAWRKRR